MTKEVRKEVVLNRLDRYIRLKQAEMITEAGSNVPMKTIYKEIGEACGVKGNTIAMLKSGNYNPSLAMSLKLSRYFGVTVNELFYLKGGNKDE